MESVVGGVKDSQGGRTEDSRYIGAVALVWASLLATLAFESRSLFVTGCRPKGAEESTSVSEGSKGTGWSISVESSSHDGSHVLLPSSSSDP